MTYLFAAGLINAAIAAALAACVWLLTRRWRHPALVHALWVLVLVKLVTPPMVTIPWRFATADPSTSPSLVNDAAAIDRVDFAVQSDEQHSPQAAVLTGTGLIDPLPVPHSGPGEDPVAPVALPTIATDDDQTNMARFLDGSVSTPGTGPAIPWATLGIGTWLAGSAVFIFVSVLRMIRFHRALAHTKPVPDTIRTLADHVAAHLGLSGRYRIRVTEGRLPPLVWPLGRPTVVMPAHLLEELSDEEIQTLLAHELAHLRRRDHWVRWLELAATWMYWWNPVVWWARTVIQRAEEEACDDWVVATLPDSAVRYASALFKAAQFISEDCRTEPILASALSSGGELKERIEHVMNATREPRLKLPVRLSVLLAALLILPFSLHAVRATDDTVSSSEQGVVSEEQDALETSSDAAAATHEAPNDENAEADYVGPVDVVDTAQIVPADTAPAAEPDALDAVLAGPQPSDERAFRETQRLRPGMVVSIKVAGTPAPHPINDKYSLEPDGNVALGPVYGRVLIGGMTIVEAESALTDHLKKVLRDPQVQVTLQEPLSYSEDRATAPVPPTQVVRPRIPVPAHPYHINPGDVLAVSVINALADQPIDGSYVVEPSGSLPLGPTYGRVNVAGMTLEDAEKAVTAHLAKILEDPKLQITIGGWRDGAISFVEPTSVRRDDTPPGNANSVNRTPNASLNSFAAGDPAALPTQNINAIGQQPRGQSNPEVLKALREHVEFLENHFQRAEARFRSGSAGGSAFAQALAGYELATAQGELALVEGNQAAAQTRFTEAEKYAEQALVAAQAHYATGTVQDDALLEAAQNLSNIKRRLAQVGSLADPYGNLPQGATGRGGTALSELPQSAPAPAITESIGVLRKIVDRERRKSARLEELARQNAVSATEVAVAKSEYDIAVERLRQAERGLKYHQLLLEAAAADYEALVEANKKAPNSVTAAQLRRAKLAMELTKAKLDELSE